MQPRISVVIPTHQQTYLSKALAALIHCFGFNDSIEIVVVENPEETTEVADVITEVCNNRPYNIAHISCKLGANRARNAGIEYASGEIIALLDDDCIVSREWLNAILSAHALYPNAGIMGGPMKLVFQTEKPRWIADYFWYMLAGVDHGGDIVDFSHTVQKYSGMIVSGNLTFKKHIFNQTQGFDESVGYIGKDSLMAHDEIRLIYECAQLGRPKKLYIGPMIAFHYIPKNRIQLSYFLKRAYGDGFNFMRMLHNDNPKHTPNIEDVTLDHLLPQWNEHLHFSALNQVRSQMAHEESVRLYIKNLMLCKLEYFKGAFDYMIQFQFPTNTPSLVIDYTHASHYGLTHG